MPRRKGEQKNDLQDLPVPEQEMIPLEDWSKTPAGFRSGFVAIVGRPNVGKSTLLNRLVGVELAVATHKPQTTRNRITGIYNDERSQIVFIDTPGIHLLQSEINKFFVSEAQKAIEDSDICLLMEEAWKKKPGEENYEPDDELKLILQALTTSKKPIYMAINKIDLIKQKKLLLPQIDAMKNLLQFKGIFLISATGGDGMTELLNGLYEGLKEGPRYFPPDMISDKAERFFVAELVRKQVMLTLHQEVPYVTSVVVESFEEIEEKNMVHISAQIVTERDSHKKIIIGKGGAKIKEIGIRARKEIEAFLNVHVFLELFVKVVPNWTQKRSLIEEYANISDS